MKDQEEIVVLRRLLLAPGQRLHIEDGLRRGDWEVLGVDERKLRLRCPVSGKEVEWDRLCYQVARRAQSWPLEPDTVPDLTNAALKG